MHFLAYGGWASSMSGSQKLTVRLNCESPFVNISCYLQWEKLPDFNAFPANLHWREDSKFFPRAESWLVNLNFPRSSRMQGVSDNPISDHQGLIFWVVAYGRFNLYNWHQWLYSIPDSRFPYRSMLIQICPGLTLIRCMPISISSTKCLIALLLNFNIVNTVFELLQTSQFIEPECSVNEMLQTPTDWQIKINFWIL